MDQNHKKFGVCSRLYFLARFPLSFIGGLAIFDELAGSMPLVIFELSFKDLTFAVVENAIPIFLIVYEVALILI